MKKLVVVTLACAVLASACSKSDSSTSADTGRRPNSEDTLVVVMGGEAASLDPQASNDQPSSRVNKQIYNSLVSQDQNMNIVPALAESWEITENGTVLTMKLVEAVKFHNGEILTANDVKFTLQRALKSPPVQTIVEAIDPDGITVIDDTTIEITLLFPFAPILSHLAHTGIGILNEKAVTEGGDSYGQNPVGTGPYKFVDWKIGDNITLVKNDEYFKEPAKIENIMIRVITENAARAIALETGDVDIAYEIAPNDIARIEENPNLRMIRSPNFSTHYVGFNLTREPFGDVRVRQAINLALDMESIIEAVYFGAGKPAKGPLGQKVWAYNTDIPGYGYDVEAAKVLLTEAGYPDGFPTSILVNDNQQRIDIAEIAQAQLAEIGIALEIEILEWGTYLEKTAAGDHDMFISGWVTVTGDPDYGLYGTFHTDSSGSAGNSTFYSNVGVDELLDTARSSSDPAVREVAYKEAQQIIFDDAPWIFTWEGEDLNGVQRYVKGFVNNPAGHHALDTVYFTAP